MATLAQVALSLRVHYEGGARDSVRSLCLLPRNTTSQRVVTQTWHCEPAPDAATLVPGPWGAQFLRLQHRHIPSELHFEMGAEVEVHGQDVPATVGAIEGYLRPTWLCDWPKWVRQQAQAARRQFRGSPRRLAEHLNHLAFACLSYDYVANAEPLPVSQVLAKSSGSCQDFAHLHLALCRCACLPARYVAGFNPAEGQMHAWTQVLLFGRWIGFDPTHDRAPSPGCVQVGTGRDFRDVRPVSGFYRGEGARLELHCRTQILPSPDRDSMGGG